MTWIEVLPPDWVREGSVCDTCGHFSTFSAGFEYEGKKYISGRYEDQISCLWSASYENALDEDSEDTLERFKGFLSTMNTEEAAYLLTTLEEIF